MQSLFFSIYDILGTVTFIAGIVLLMIELFRRGLSPISAVSYVCFALSILFLSQSVLYFIIALSGLSVLFILLYTFYRRDKKSIQSEEAAHSADEEEE